MLRIAHLVLVLVLPLPSVQSTTPPTPLEHWKSISEVASNFAQALAVLGGIFFLVKWLRERSDRTTEILLRLENRFNAAKVLEGRRAIDHDGKYEEIRGVLDQWVRSTDRGHADFDKLTKVDAMLRFYMILRGVLQAGQVNLASARTCFRYYLCHFYHPDRDEFRRYVEHSFPTLTTWLKEDKAREPLSWWRRKLKLDARFATPEDFVPGWEKTHPAWLRPTARLARGRVLILTGAGISADSGIQTYRGAGGFWSQLDFEQMATRKAFTADPDRVWRWYDERRRKVIDAPPNAGHEAVARIARNARECLVVTQNVDDLHERTDLSSDQLVHVHGKLLESRCLACGVTRGAKPDDASRLCDTCREGRLRPAVVWFDEELPPEAVERINEFLSAGPCDLVLVVGTTASFDYIRRWIETGAGTDGSIVDVNPEDSQELLKLDRKVVRVRERAAEALPGLAAAAERVPQHSSTKP
jgi:NAD-dependent deacetylase